ncbi:hypothetical protein [Chromohalobacter sp. 296-RDG]|uniref:hypothetical protein n=1 Tax=Chromohalobacter sp. 296-RDG TaxID=2994062 RepID=UPI0024690F58|nr:hypothetical protein [Chromohalobacter sp. 296-RDG]
MNRELEKRLAALEQQAKGTDDQDPSRMYHAMLELGLEAPEPMGGETCTEWLTRVPTKTLEPLMHWSDANVQP